MQFGWGGEYEKRGKKEDNVKNRRIRIEKGQVEARGLNKCEKRKIQT
jgi:hypothetical protein